MASVDQIRKMIEAAQGPSGPMGDAVSKKLKESYPPSPGFKLSNRDFLMGRAVKRWGVPEDHIQRVFDRIQYIESKDDPKKVQTARGGGEGPGRGLFQFEKGKDQGAHTAFNRLIGPNLTDPRIAFTLGPEWDDFEAADYDATKLTAGQQGILLLGDLLGKPGAMAKSLANDTMRGDEDFWIKRHWSKDKTDLDYAEEEAKHRQHWRNDLKIRVIEGQRALVSGGFGPKSKDAQRSFIDGKMGPATKAAIKKFQAQNRIRQTEYFDKETRDLLGM
jgi:hypothetical protein